MSFKEATSRRITELLKEYNFTPNNIAEKSGIPTQSLYDIINCNSNKHYTYTIYILCKGLGIKMTEFYNSPFFDNLID